VFKIERELFGAESEKAEHKERIYKRIKDKS